MECYLKSKPVNENGVPIRGYRQRMFRVWQEKGLFESTEHRICDQARAIGKNGWLPELKIEVSESKMLVQKGYNRRHDNIARLVHWKLCCQYDISRGEKWYEHQPEGVVENEKYRILSLMSRNARDDKNGRFGERAPQLTMLAKLAILATS